jgi:hypothetical protein
MLHEGEADRVHVPVHQHVVHSTSRVAVTIPSIVAKM